MTFVWPWALGSLLLIPAMVWLYIRQVQIRLDGVSELGSFSDLAAGRAREIRVRRHLPPAFMILGLSLLLIGLARPQMTIAVPRTEGTVILAFDVSNSMAAKDVEPSRMEAAKAAARVMIDQQPPAVRLGVVAFGGSSLIVQAPTDDRAAVLEAVDRLDPQGGTSIGGAIFASLNAIAGKALAISPEADLPQAGELRIEDYSSAVVVLFTDGENTDTPDPLEIGQLAAEAGVRVYTIGFGSTEGATIEVDGFTIHTQLDEGLLQAIAGTTNGAYYRAEDADSLAAIYDEVDLQLTTRAEQMEITALAAGLSTLLLLTGAGLSLNWFGRVP